MLVPELATKKKLKEKRNILIPRSMNFDLLNPKINIDVLMILKKNINLQVKIMFWVLSQGMEKLPYNF